VGKRTQLIFLALFAAFSVSISGCESKKSAPIPVLGPGPIPDFSLVDQDGNTFQSSDLKGKPYIISFFFTSCQTICPKIMGAMQKVQEQLIKNKLDAHLVSISVDPVTDTPQRLKETGVRYQVDSTRWHLLTGTEAAVEDVVVKKLKTYLGKKTTRDGVMDIGHGGHLLLIDGKGRMRGKAFEANPEGIDQLIRTVRQLIR
tara:strand:+ start:8090 stop:8692 length:603 start_codon:yes stop_codon:yes gene_type:complete